MLHLYLPGALEIPEPISTIVTVIPLSESGLSTPGGLKDARVFTCDEFGSLIIDIDPTGSYQISPGVMTTVNGMECRYPIGKPVLIGVGPDAIHVESEPLLLEWSASELSTALSSISAAMERLK